MEQVDVLVVGGGGCGLVLASLLHDHGVDFTLVERKAETSRLPKAHYLNPRTMELLRQHGLADEIHARGTPLYNRSRIKWYTSFGGDGPLDRKTLFDISGRADTTEDLGLGNSTSPSDSANLPQIRLEPIFRQHAEQRAGGRIRFEHEFVSLEQDDDGITATIRNLVSGEVFQIRSRYLVVADGGRTVGQQLGVEMAGQKDLSVQVNIHFEADLSQHYPDDRVMMNLLRPATDLPSRALVPMGPDAWGRHSREWGMGLQQIPGQPEWDKANVVPMIRAVLGIPDLDIIVHTVSRWTVGGLVADRYRVGRAFMAGDAAHRHPPTTGLGLNTGIQDAHNLAWKLGAVLRGEADETLLDSYQAERRPIGEFNVEWALNSFFNHMLLNNAIPLTSPGEIAQMQSPAHKTAAFAATFADTPNGRMRRARLEKIFTTQSLEFGAKDVEMGFVYPEGAFLPDGTPAPERDPMGQQYHPVARPGHRLPHVWLERDGVRLSSHDFATADGGFALLCGAKGSAWKQAAEKLATELGVKLTAVAIGYGGDVVDAETRWEALRGVGDDGAVLVRPDNIVGWRSVSASPDAEADLRAALAACLGRTV